MREQRGVVVHIAEGSYEGTISWQKNPDAEVSSHFVVALDGAIAQVVDTDIAAWTQGSGNGAWLSIENAGFHTGQLTVGQVEANAQILARAHREYGVPLQVATSPDGRGLGHHGMGGLAWGGHYDCPGPNNVALKPTIVARAIEVVNGVDMADSVLMQGEAWRMHCLATGDQVVPDGPTKGEGMWTVKALQELRDGVAALSVGGIDVDALADQLATKLAANQEFIGAVANATADVQAQRLTS